MATNVGDILPDHQEVFRAFAEKSYRDRAKNRVRPRAFLLLEKDVQDGLSVGLTPKGAVAHLQRNEGYCKISVGAIHTLPFNLQVKRDPSDAQHAFICNLPLLTASDSDREKAMLIAGELARRSIIITCDPFMPE
jgi:hypothetical protein